MSTKYEKFILLFQLCIIVWLIAFYFNFFFFSHMNRSVKVSLAFRLHFPVKKLWCATLSCCISVYPSPPLGTRTMLVLILCPSQGSTNWRAAIMSTPWRLTGDRTWTSKCAVKVICNGCVYNTSDSNSRCDFDDTAQYRVSAMNSKGENSAFASVVVKSRSEINHPNSF